MKNVCPSRAMGESAAVSGRLSTSLGRCRFRRQFERGDFQGRCDEVLERLKDSVAADETQIYRLLFGENDVKSCHASPRGLASIGALIICLAICLNAAGCSALPLPGLEHNPGVSLDGPETTLRVVESLHVSIPESGRKLRVWLPFPHPFDLAQDLVEWDLRVSVTHRSELTSDRWGNRYLVIEADVNGRREVRVQLSLELRRRPLTTALTPSHTRPHRAEELDRFERYLSSSPISPAVSPALARNPIDAALEILAAGLEGDSSIERSEQLATRLQNLGVPSRLLSGARTMPEDAEEHSWIEFHAPNLGWVPLDADAISTPGTLAADRVTWRYLEAVAPRVGPRSDPAAFTGTGTAEVDGDTVRSRFEVSISEPSSEASSGTSISAETESRRPLGGTEK